ncbi:hypothetical protein GCM10023238_34970 [Streptomyces heliomycini]
MRKPLVVALCALAFAGAGATPAVASAPSPTGADTTADAAPTTLTDVVDGVVGTAADALSALTAPREGAVNFAGAVSLSNCSGSVVRMPGSAADDPALVLTNGHCLESGFPAPGQVLVDRASSRTFGLAELLRRQGRHPARRPARVRDHDRHGRRDLPARHDVTRGSRARTASTR